MSSKQLRLILRNGHIVSGILLAAFIYVPSLQTNISYMGLIQLIVVPLLILSGLSMWQLPRFNKWRSQQRRAVQS
ncbi:MAG: hypothetical protein KC708_09185 [Anaerolineae bacterium]|nr:hypothetical protein [Anaerolineae bacterium]